MQVEGGGIPGDDRKLYLKMLRNDIGVSESVTRAEIEHHLDLISLDGSIETILQSMVSHGLVKEREEILTTRRDIPASGKRRVKTYQLLLERLE